jgi:hypothetical protein
MTTPETSEVPVICIYLLILLSAALFAMLMDGKGWVRGDDVDFGVVEEFEVGSGEGGLRKEEGNMGGRRRREKKNRRRRSGVKIALLS